MLGQFRINSQCLNQITGDGPVAVGDSRIVAAPRCAAFTMSNTGSVDRIGPVFASSSSFLKIGRYVPLEIGAKNWLVFICRRFAKEMDYVVNWTIAVSLVVGACPPERTALTENWLDQKLSPTRFGVGARRRITVKIERSRRLQNAMQLDQRTAIMAR